MPRNPIRVLGLALLLLVPRGVFAQARLTGADLDGSVRDESGAVMPGATITVNNTATNITRTATTNAQGHFLIPALPPGTYRVGAELQGFTKAAHEGLVLQLGQSVSVDFTLKVAKAEEELTVLAEAPLVDVHDASVSSVVADQQIQGLPINGRNFISFAVITPGVTIDNTPQQGASATSGLSFAGQRARSNSVMVDGLDNNDAALGSVRAVFSQEAVREFQVLTNSYSAEFGKASGGVVNIVTKSGSNDVHGNVFGYFRDDALNSKSHFEQFDVFGNEIQAEKSPFRQYQYGGTLGGPIKKDKTFYFLSFERLDTSDSNLVTISEADAAVLNGAGFEVKTGANPFEVKQTQVLAKVDHQWNPNSNLVLRANFSDVKNENAEPFGGLVARSRGGVRLATDYSFSASQTNMLGGRWVNEARIQYARQDQEVNALDPRCGGECTGTDQGGPTLEIGRIAVGRQRFTPQPRLSDRIQVVDTVSLFAGRHQLKAGFDFNYIKNRDALPLQFGGRYIFGSMAAVAAGTPAAYVQGYGNDRAPYNYNDVSLFVQDEWRLSRKLTIKPGVRYQRQFFPDVAYDVGLPGGERYRYAYPEDKNNIAPRLSVSFDPKGNGRTALHASYGIFYDNTLTSTVFITDALDGGPNGVRTLVAAGPVAIAAWNAPDHRLSEAQVLGLLGGAYPSLMFAIDPNLKTPYAHQAALGFEQAIGKSVSITVNAIYARGKHQLGTIDFNPRVPALGHPAARPNDVGGRPGTSASILQYTSFGETWYKGVTAAVQKHYRKGSQFLVSYTLSKSEDNSTDFQSQFVPQSMGFGRNPADPAGLPVGGPARCVGASCQLPFDPLAEKGPAVWDQRHRLVVSGLYELPGALQISGIMSFATGRPFTALAGVDTNGDGNGGAFPPDRARRSPADITTSVVRNSERLPSQFTVDARLSRKFRLGGEVFLEPIVEVFNLLNRTNYSDVNNIFGTGAYPDSPARDAQGRVTYGTFTQAQPPRQFQLAAKLSF
jgi:Carboxypeptidase regulatory-like domain/TonB dependent receptor/TonB-dependent Receptor Plug Domain